MSIPSREQRRSSLGWLVLRILLGAETLLLLGVTVFSIVESIAQPAAPAQNLSIVVMSALCFAWVALTFWGAQRSRTSAGRASALTIHVLLFAAGTGMLQLAIGPWQLGLALVAAALIGFVSAMLARPELPEGGSSDD